MTALDIPIGLGREEAQRRAVEELSRWRYGFELPPWLTDWIRTLLRWFDTFLNRWLPEPVRPGQGGSNPIVLVLVVLVLAGLILLVWRFGLPRFERRRRDAEVGASAEVSAKQYRSLAEAAAASGDWRTAVRERFRSLVRELEVRTVLTPRPSRTALETAWTAGRVLPGSREPLLGCAATFGEIEYGDTVATGEHYRRLTEVERAVLAEADRVDADVLDEVAR